MTRTVTQTFPVRQGGTVMHRTWDLDLEAARPIAERDGFDLDRLRREAREMNAHFPRWLLTLQSGREVDPCHACGGLVVFDRGVRCAVCQLAQPAGRGAALAWFGTLPPIGVDGLPRVRERLLARPPARHAMGVREGIGTYLLVPLLVTYPPGFPAKELHVSYLPGLFAVQGFPPEKASHDCHLLDRGRMCLFASGQWTPSMTAREVLQQRAYAHAIKLLNHVDGKRDAFARVS